MKLLGIAALTLTLVACGGGSGGGEGAVGGGGDGSNNHPEPAPHVVAGGPVNAPATIDPYGVHVFEVNSPNVYFKHDGVIGERLIFRVVLDRPLNTTEFARCASNPGAYPTQIHVRTPSLERVGGTCSEDLVYEFTEDGTRLFQFEFTSNGPTGHFYVESLPATSPVSFDTDGYGTPGHPLKLDLAHANEITAVPFFNYYWVSATKGQTLVVHASLDTPLTQQQRTRCASNPGQLNSQIRIYDDRLNRVHTHCGIQANFVVPETGMYVVQFHYGQTTGLATAALIE